MLSIDDLSTFVFGGYGKNNIARDVLFDNNNDKAIKLMLANKYIQYLNETI